MNVNQKWRDLGWRHPLWDYVRYYSVVRAQGEKVRKRWEEKLHSNTMEIDANHDLAIPDGHADLFFDYLRSRETDFDNVVSSLRTEEEALDYCDRIGA
jgi:hypothetical protein